MKLISTMRDNWKKPMLWSVLLFLAFGLPAFAQNARLELKNLEKLSSKASEVNDISLDGAMLQFAAKFLEKDDSEEAEIKDLLKNLKGIYIKSFEFDKDNQYSQADVDAIRSQLTAPGWTKMVESRSNRGHEIDEVFLMKDHDMITGVAILVAEPRELTVVNIVGPINMDRLADLEGLIGESHHPDKEKRQNKPTKGAAPNDNDKTEKK
jgi:Domain of unknown function (DUF4252)